MAVASHLAAKGVKTRVFGKPMDFWHSQMPKGMLLRSPWSGSSIGDPHQAFTLDKYETALGSPLSRRLPLEDFVRYGQWFQRQALPDLDSRNVAGVARTGDDYLVTLDDGESFHSANVVVATGIGSFAHRPAVFGSLPPELCSHASDRQNSDLGRFAGKRVAVIGAGQSAFESAVLLREQGADVEILMRQSQLRWVNTRPFIESLLDSKLYPLKAPARIGPIGLNWLVEHPALFTIMPRELQRTMSYRAIRPAASSWLRPRTENIAFTTGRHVITAGEGHARVCLKLDDGVEREFDHVLLGTSYRIDIARYRFLSADLLQRVRAVNGYPVLNRGFESSVMGLYFVGTTASYSFGPYLRFVAGSQYAATVLSRYAVRTRTRSRDVLRSYRQRPAPAAAR